MTNRKKRKKLTKRAIIISAILVILSLFASIAYVYGIDYYRRYYACATVAIDFNKYPVTGIDISSHQGKIDWKLVSESKVSFAFIKATEGMDFQDKMFETNWKNAKKNNVIVGAYHFFRFNKDGKWQARNFINKVKLSENDLPPVVDFEASYGNRLSKYNVKYMQNQLLKCLRELEKHYKCKPIIYTNTETYNKYIKGSFDEYPLWLCKLCNEPSKATKWTFWQYSHKGGVPGIKGNVDMNVYNGTYKEFVNYIYNSHKQQKKSNVKKNTTKKSTANRRNTQNSARKTK